jgi:NADH dehydrogenase
VARALDLLAAAFLGPESRPAAPVPAAATRIVILGGGFAGVTTAAHLERAFGADPCVSLTLVSDTNALLFTPLLAEVAGGSLEAAHISSPLRTSLRRTAVIRGRVTAIDLERRCVRLAPGARLPGPSPDGADGGQELAYDHFVLALGAVPNYVGLSDVQARAFEFKSLGDALRIRNHVIDMFERADSEPDPTMRSAMVTFVVAGGGFAREVPWRELNPLTGRCASLVQPQRAREAHPPGTPADRAAHTCSPSSRCHPAGGTGAEG